MDGDAVVYKGEDMNLVIHDLNKEEWEKTSAGYEGWTIISNDGNIRPCNGCFCCWHKTPGECVIKDGYGDMGKLIHDAEEVVVISKYTYGGFSSFVKNVFDRCLGYVLPQLEPVKGESHHQKRYPEEKPMSFIFYGHDLNEEEKKSAVRYVTAVCANVRGIVKEVIFRESEEKKINREENECNSRKVILLNGSMRFTNGNSAILAKQLAKQLNKETETIALGRYLKDMPALIDKLEEAQSIVFCVPLYVDGLPGQVIRLMETWAQREKVSFKKIYVLGNMGLYECEQLVNLFEAVRQWSDKMGFEYGGALGVSAGELIGVLMQHLKFGGWPTQKIARGMNRLSKTIDEGGKTEDIYTEPYLFPRSIYLAIANTNWNSLAKKNGIRPKDLYRQL